MYSWAYIFSQFTPEALLLEALIIFLLCGGYAAFWVLKKRRYGIIDTSIPSGPVKTYLNELINNSEQLRLQLFGLLNSSAPNAKGFELSPSVENTDLAHKLASLESKLNDQLKAFEVLTSEKIQVEKELADARSAASQKPSQNSESPQTGDSMGENTGEIKTLQEKIQKLEGRLFEYSVIEDDLANLKRLQQENIILKQTLTSKGVSIPSLAESTPQPKAPETKTVPAPPPQTSGDNSGDNNDTLVSEFEKLLKS